MQLERGLPRDLLEERGGRIGHSPSGSVLAPRAQGLRIGVLGLCSQVNVNQQSVLQRTSHLLRWLLVTDSLLLVEINTFPVWHDREAGSEFM